MNLQFGTDSSPFYRRLAAALRSELRCGGVRPGERLPSTRELAQRFGVHRHTVLAAYEQLVAEGWVESLPGWGFRVAAAEVEPNPQTPASDSFVWRFSGDLPVAPERALPPARWRFPSGQPDLRVFPHEEYYAQVRQALRRCPAEELLGYSEPGGRPLFCQELSHYLARARGLSFTPDQLVVTHGCQEAAYLAARCWLSPGDRVAVEEQGFPKIWEALRCCGAELVPIRVDEQGLCPDALERILNGGGVRLIYTTPLHQYPTTVTLPQGRRQALYQLAQRFGVPILEDDYDFEFHYQGSSLPPLKSADPDGLVIYCSTFSKVLHPSARLGFLIAPQALAERVARLKSVVSRQNDNLVQEAVAGWMREGGFERHLRRMRRHYRERRQVMAEALNAWPEARWRLPDGGMCCWVDTGVDSRRLSQAALQAGIDIRAGDEFRLDGGSSTCLRLGFAYPRPDEIRTGMARLASLAGSL